MRRNDSIRLSKKHGLAPALAVCLICHEETNEIALLGHVADKIEGFGFGTRVPSSQPCERCSEAIRDGAVALIAKKTGRSLMFSREGARKIFQGNPEGVLFGTEELFDRVLSMIPPEMIGVDSRPQEGTQ